MLHLWVIALFMSIIWRDMVDRPLAAGLLTPLEVTLAVIGPMAGICAVMWIVAARAANRMDATGSAGAIRTAEVALSVTRWAAVIVHAVGVIALGWLDVVRRETGDIVILDELLSMGPALAVFVVGWWSVYPIDQRLREATIFRSLHAESPEQAFYPVPSRWQFVLMHVRHQLLLTLAPLVLIGTWTETSHWVMRGLGRWARTEAGTGGHDGLSGQIARTLASGPTLAVVATSLQLLGVLCVFILAPVVMRFVWNTSRLPQGELRDRLLEMCRRQGIRVRNILVWRTHGTMMNGAVMGLIAPARYILLTDVLIDSMPTPELEAVMAHELAHVRHRHIIWLGLSLMVSVGVAAAIIGLAASLLGVGASLLSSDAMELGVTAIALALGMVCFGYISRRFEWQADAFAACCLSVPLLPPPDQAQSPVPTIVTQAGAATMIRALDRVGRLNHIPPDKPSWRHGSIKVRHERLASIAGLPVASLPIDRAVRRIKWTVGLIASGGVVLMLWDLIEVLLGGRVI